MSVAIGAMSCVCLRDQAPPWLSQSLDFIGYKVDKLPDDRSSPSLAQVGVQVLGLAMVSTEGLVPFSGPLTRFHREGRLLFDALHRPLDCCEASVVESWKLQTAWTVSMARQSTRLDRQPCCCAEVCSIGACRSSSFTRFSLKSHIFIPVACAEFLLELVGSDSRTMEDVLGLWGMQGGKAS